MAFIQYSDYRISVLNLHEMYCKYCEHEKNGGKKLLLGLDKDQDQVGGFFLEISCCPTLTSFLRVIATVLNEVSSKWNSRLKRFK